MTPTPPHPHTPTQKAHAVAAPRLSEYTTFRLGGPCRRLIACATPQDLETTLRELRESRQRHLLIGGGSNLLISDHGVDVVVVRFASDAMTIRGDGGTIEVDACASLDALALHLARVGLAGLMCCTGIPGTVGGAVVGNAGAWGRQIADALESVELLDSAGRKARALPRELDFAYRDSRLKQTGDVVLSARLRVAHENPARLLAEREEILRKRAERHPDLRKDPCIGSIFRNLEPTSAAGHRQAAGWFLEQAGAKEMRVGGARVFERHANIIVKGEDCTAQDVRDLAENMKTAVRQKFGFELVREVRYLGRFRGEAEPPPAGFY